jgi:hypothetical protein
VPVPFDVPVSCLSWRTPSPFYQNYEEDESQEESSIRKSDQSGKFLETLQNEELELDEMGNRSTRKVEDDLPTNPTTTPFC